MNNTLLDIEYGYCRDCKCWHSKYDKCSDIQNDRLNKDKNGSESI